MVKSICILGRQPELGIAELESLYGSENLTIIGLQAVVLDVEPPMVNFARLGGTVKFGKVLTVLDTTDWKKIEAFVASVAPEHAANLPEGKMRLGLSVYGLGVSPKQLLSSGLTLKKGIKATGRSIRLVPNIESGLSSAQVLHNQLTQKLGWELLFIRDGNKTIVGQSIAVQDITAYTLRDRGRPMRDAKVGMLPPKLAQIIVNLAVGRNYEANLTILDPFCGTGVLLQEAGLMGYSVYGTDLEPRMIEYSATNLTWLEQVTEKTFAAQTEVGDATNHTWKSFDLVACETYLGRPLNSLPAPDKLREIMQDCDTIHRKFLRNLARQTKPGFKACIAVPAWKAQNGFLHLKTLDSLEELGYNRISFAHVDKSLIYHRPEQTVARELVIIQRK